MKRDLNKFVTSPYDVLVIGGGINGAAIAHLASLQGLKVALFEKNDFASGTSSKSTKLIHGGLRYLENFEFGLVREALKERSVLLQSTPHLVKPIPIILPVYRTDRRPLWLIHWGACMYDLLSGRSAMPKHSFLESKKILNIFPQLKKDNLLGGVLYYDAQMNDARLCLENVLSADKQGACVANYVEVKKFLIEKGKAIGVIAYDRIGQRTWEVMAKKIICAVGPWTNEFLNGKIRITKGVHIIYPGQIFSHGLFVQAKQDQRFIFVLPWMGNTLVGTTDTDFTGNPDDPKVDREDIEYLVTEMMRIYPGGYFSKDKIISTFAGLRSLVPKQGQPSRVSRRHKIEESQEGILYVMGGKYTTYRRIAEDCLTRVRKQKIVFPSNGYVLYGSGVIQELPKEVAQKTGCSLALIKYLMDFYGTRYKDVLNVPCVDGLEPICSCSPMVKAQVVYALETEMACCAEDIIERRLPLVYNFCLKGSCRQKIKELCRN